MPNIILRQISRLTQALTTPWAGVIPFSEGTQTKILTLAQLRTDILASAQLTGTPSAPTPNISDNSARVATTEFVQQALTGVGVQPATAASYGTVRTNTTASGAAIVYLREEVDALIAAAIVSAAPPGSISAFAGSTAPTGFLLCNGAAVGRNAYAALFAALGTTYGAGDGTTTFNLPDLRGRTAIGVGQGSGLTNRALGAAGGAETHALVAAESAYAHTHPRETGWRFATVPDSGGEFIVKLFDGVGGAIGLNRILSIPAGANGGNPHNNMPPFVALNYLIKT
jgi:microcystin-dependent protein